MSGEQSVDICEVRADPERFLGDAGDGTALHNLAYELVALSIMESMRQAEPPPVTLTLLGPRRLRIADEGRGMAMHIEPGHEISHAEHALTRFYPVPAPNEGLREFLTDWVWGTRGSQGPVVVNALAERLDMVSVRGSDRWSLSFERGVAIGPPTRTDASDTSGTSITIVADSQVFARQAFDPVRLEAHLAQLQAANPRATVSFQDETS